MLDINRLFGFVFHAANPSVFTCIKYALVEATTTFDVDDAAVVMGEYKQGPGAITAEIMNCNPLSDYTEFLDMSTAVANVISESDINSPKLVFIISDVFPGHADFEMQKMKLFNENCSYPSKLYIMQIHPTARLKDSGDNQWVILRDAIQLQTEVGRIIREVDVC